MFGPALLRRAGPSFKKGVVNMIRRTGIILVILVLLLAPMSRAAEKTDVFVSITPQRYFVQQIAGDLVNIHVMVAPGASPATYEPLPKQMTGLSGAGAYFSIGVPFEKTWLPRFRSANPDLPVFPTHEGIQRIPMKSGKAPGQDHHPVEGRGLDPHIWLSPKLVALQARNILTGLCEILPDQAPLFRRNYQNFLRDLTALDMEIMERFDKDLRNRAFVVFHPSWGYFARDYGLEQIAIEVEGKALKQKELMALVKSGRQKGWKAVFVQPQFSRKAALALAGEMEAEVLPLDPLAENWEQNLRKASRKLQEALK